MMKHIFALVLVLLTSLALAQSRGQYWETIASPEQSIIQAQLGQESAIVWQSGSDTLTFAYAQSAKKSVFLCCGVQVPVSQVAGKFYAVTIKFQQLEQAVLSWQFADLGNSFNQLSSLQVWRGSKAPAAPETRVIFRNQLKTETIVSRELKAAREVSLYFPPNFDSKLEHFVVYAADGQSIESYAQVLEPEIVAKRLPQVVLIGIHNSQERYEEYVDKSSALFLAHERFVLREVIPQLEQKYGLTPKSRLLFGVSNGADWVIRMLARNPDIWTGGVALSPFNPIGFDFKPNAPLPALYLEAGLYEDPGFQTARTMKSAAEFVKMRVIYNEKAAGHDHVVWREEFPIALQWLLKK